MFGIRRGLKRKVSKLVKRGKNDPSPQKPVPTSTAPGRPIPSVSPEPAPLKAVPEPAPAAPVPSAPAPVVEAKPALAKPALTGIAAMIAAGAAAEVDEIDLSVSYTSGPAAEAAVAAMAGRNMINHAKDGTAYWGFLDNDSARSRAAGETLVIDQWECIQCGTCVENTEQVFILPDDAKAVVYRQEGPMELIQDAIDACPVTCIHWTHEPEQYEQLNDTEGHAVGDTA